MEFNRISKSPAKIKVIQEMPRFSNVEEVSKFLGVGFILSSIISRLNSHIPLTTLVAEKCQMGIDFKWKRETPYLQIKAEIKKTLKPDLKVSETLFHGKSLQIM